MKVLNYDVKFIPHFIPLMDLGGVVYPIRIFLNENDICDEEGEIE